MRWLLLFLKFFKILLTYTFTNILIFVKKVEDLLSDNDKRFLLLSRLKTY